MSYNTYQSGYGAVPNYSNVFVSTGTVGGAWSTTGTTYTIPAQGTSGSSWVSIGQDATKASLKVTGNAEISGNLTVDGVNIGELLKGIQSQLGLLVPNPELEAEFDQLRELGDRYRELESVMKEQKRVWDILKKE
jgi:hypothetical protein